MIDKLVFLVFDITFFMKVTIPPKLMIFRYKLLYTKKKTITYLLLPICI